MKGLLRYRAAGGVVQLTLDRPERRNALSPRLLDALQSALDEAGADPRTRVLCLGATGPAFCAGIDLKEVDLSRPAQARELADRLSGVYRTLLAFPVPVLSSVGGAAAGGGVGLAAAADIAWAGPKARFQLPEVRIGLVPAMVSVVLRRRLAPKRVSAMALGGVVLGPADALAAGLVDILAGGAADTEMVRFAGDLARDHSAGALRRTKAFLDRRLAAGLDAELAAARAEFRAAAATEDVRRGLAAFRRKERVRWNER